MKTIWENLTHKVDKLLASEDQASHEKGSTGAHFDYGKVGVHLVLD